MDMIMKKYKLYYFNVTGLAEPIRYLLNYCGIPFEDERLDYMEQWLPKYKQEMPMEQVPVLEIDGVKYHQHVPICRYIARENNLCGSNEEEAYQIDALVADINDIRLEVGRWYREEDVQLKAVLKERALKPIPFYLSKFETRVERNNGFFVGNKLSWVDIYYAAISELMSNILQQDLNNDYPNLKKLSNEIRSHPMIAPYINKRPVTII